MPFLWNGRVGLNKPQAFCNSHTLYFFVSEWPKQWPFLLCRLFRGSAVPCTSNSVFFEHCIDPRTLTWFLSWSPVEHSRDTCLEEKSRFGSVWLSPLSEHVTYSLRCFQSSSLNTGHCPHFLISKFISNQTSTEHPNLTPCPSTTELACSPPIQSTGLSL